MPLHLKVYKFKSLFSIMYKTEQQEIKQLAFCKC
jgi:hypothetical protein